MAMKAPSIGTREAFKESAKGLRWRILAGQRYSVREVDLILAIESLWKVFLLAMESIPSRPWTILACAVWTAQISVALVTLTFDMVDGKSFNDTYKTHGIVNASNLACYEWLKHECNWGATAHARAHQYGERAQDSGCGLYNDITDVVTSEHNHAYYCSQHISNREFAYRFNEYNPEDSEGIYPRFTDRTITASSGECLVYDSLNETFAADVDGQGAGSNFTYSNGTFTEHIQIPRSSLGLSATTYMYKGFQAPQYTDKSCGPRCMWLWAYKNPYRDQKKDEKDPPRFYKCPITVDVVRNASNDSHVVPDGVARIAAVSIALQGRTSGPLHHPDLNFNQYQFYPFGTRWEVHGRTTRDVGANMAEFAIGSISRMAVSNSRIQIQGLVPHLGSHLEIRWGYVVGLFAGIILTHLVLYMSAILAIRKVVVKDDSSLAITRLLLPLLDVLGGEGTLLEGKELAKAIQTKIGGQGIAVGPRKTEDGQAGYSMDIGKGVPLRQEWPDERHPAGRYV
ncbi:MAG: hypothetical protein Q9166_006841 [cf. Caloplaca sp. 2 TL-2023]